MKQKKEAREKHRQVSDSLEKDTPSYDTEHPLVQAKIPTTVS